MPKDSCIAAGKAVGTLDLGVVAVVDARTGHIEKFRRVRRIDVSTDTPHRNREHRVKVLRHLRTVAHNIFEELLVAHAVEPLVQVIAAVVILHIGKYPVHLVFELIRPR